jgi:glucose-1-phosphate thymidylyltransferase
MKIIIPMAGIGSRLRPHTLTIPKPLTKIAGKPIVQRLVEDIVNVVNKKVDEIAFVIGPTFPKDTTEKLLKIAKSLNAKGIVTVQNEALGTAHAIYQAKKSLSGPCIIAFADTLFKANFTLNENVDGAVWVKKVSNPNAYGVVKLNDGIITDFVEKPTEFVSDLAIIGIYYFKKAENLRTEIEYLLDNNIKGGGEFQLTNALENLKQKGAKFAAGEVNDWMDCGNKDITIKTNTSILKYANEDGDKLISSNVKLENSKIIEPCYIGDNVVLKNSVIGPNVSLGTNSVVVNSTIKNALIQDKVKINNANLDNAMIGNNVIFNGDFKSVSLGDYSILE